MYFRSFDETVKTLYFHFEYLTSDNIQYFDESENFENIGDHLGVNLGISSGLGITSGTVQTIYIRWSPLKL